MPGVGKVFFLFTALFEKRLGIYDFLTKLIRLAHISQIRFHASLIVIFEKISHDALLI